MSLIQIHKKKWNHNSQIQSIGHRTRKTSLSYPLKPWTIFTPPKSQECIATHSGWKPKYTQGCCHGGRWRLEKMCGRNAVEMVEERNGEKFGVKWGGFEWGLRKMMQNPKRSDIFNFGGASKWFWPLGMIGSFYRVKKPVRIFLDTRSSSWVRHDQPTTKPTL